MIFCDFCMKRNVYGRAVIVASYLEAEVNAAGDPSRLIVLRVCAPCAALRLPALAQRDLLPLTIEEQRPAGAAAELAMPLETGGKC